MIPIQAVDSTATLQYQLQTIPYPLTASFGSSAGVTPATLILLVNNPFEDVAVTFDEIAVIVPFGQAPGDLVSSPDEQLLEVLVSDPNFVVTATRLSPAEDFLVTITQAVGSAVPIQPRQGFYVQISNVVVNDQPGLLNVVVEESIAGVSGFGVAFLPVNKLPVGFYFDNLMASLSGSPGAQAVSQVANGESVVLTWNTSVVDLTETSFQVIYSTNGGQMIEDVTTPGEWNSPPLTSDTVFTVVAHAPQPDNEFVDLFLTTSVSVQNPDLVAGSITVGSAGSPATDALTVYGVMRQRSDNVFFGTTDDPETVYIYENLVVGSGAPPSSIDGVVINRPLTITGAVHQQGGNNVFFGSTSALETVYIYENLVVGSGAPPGSITGVMINRPLTVGSSYATTLGAVTINGDVSGDITISDTLTVTGNLTANGGLSLGDVSVTTNQSTVTVSGDMTLPGATASLTVGDYNSQTQITAGTLNNSKVVTTNLYASYTHNVIAHPHDRTVSLVHSPVVSPEATIAYRGSGRLDGGRAVVALPDYFDAIVDVESVTIHLTPVDGFDRLCIATENGRKVHGSRFTVISDDPGSAQAFDWEVRARRGGRSNAAATRGS